MEKQTPHYNLSEVKDLIQAGCVRSTRSALEGGAALGFDFKGIVAVVTVLTLRDFYKSMPTRQDHCVWQDVYRLVTAAGEIYLKLTIMDGLLIVSFKELRA